MVPCRTSDTNVGAAREAGGAEHLFGRWSIADLDLALMLNRLVMNRDPVPDRLACYARDQWARPAVQRWVERVRPPP
jgi:glutathione S-transferase